MVPAHPFGHPARPEGIHSTFVTTPFSVIGLLMSNSAWNE
jgi:hypothetical protein